MVGERLAGEHRRKLHDARALLGGLVLSLSQPDRLVADLWHDFSFLQTCDAYVVLVPVLRWGPRRRPDLRPVAAARRRAPLRAAAATTACRSPARPAACARASRLAGKRGP